MKLSNFIIGLLVGIVLVNLHPTNAAQPETLIVTETKYIDRIEYVTRTELIKVNQTKPVMMEATAYTANYESTGKRPGDKGYGITFTGTEAKRGVCAVDSRYIDYGTQLYVDGYGACTAEDKGSAIKGYKVDVFIPDLAEAQEFGRQQRKVWILSDGEDINEN